MVRLAQPARQRRAAPRVSEVERPARGCRRLRAVLPHDREIAHLRQQRREILREHVDFSQLQIERIGVDNLAQPVAQRLRVPIRDKGAKQPGERRVRRRPGVRQLIERERRAQAMPTLDRLIASPLIRRREVFPETAPAVANSIAEVINEDIALIWSGDHRKRFQHTGSWDKAAVQTRRGCPRTLPGAQVLTSSPCHGDASLRSLALRTFACTNASYAQQLRTDLLVLYQSLTPHLTVCVGSATATHGPARYDSAPGADVSAIARMRSASASMRARSSGGSRMTSGQPSPAKVYAR